MPKSRHALRAARLRRVPAVRQTGREVRVNRQSYSEAFQIGHVKVRDSFPLASPSPVLAKFTEREGAQRMPRQYLAVAVDATRNGLRCFRRYCVRSGIVYVGKSGNTGERAEPLQIDGRKAWFIVDGEPDELRLLLGRVWLRGFNLATEGAVPSGTCEVGKAKRSGTARKSYRATPARECDRQALFHELARQLAGHTQRENGATYIRRAERGIPCPMPAGEPRAPARAVLNLATGEIGVVTGGQVSYPLMLVQA
jgi:hypothetical protein